MAERAATKAVGTNLRQIAHLYEVEAELTERARQYIAADTILNHY